ncbi:MAG: MBOAT family protein [Acidimicrobiia bacterium]
MSFAAPVFLWVFVPAVLLIYWVLPARFRNLVLATSSLLFYAYGARGDVVLLLVAIAVNYAAGIAIDRAVDAGRRKALLVAIVVADVGMLAYWKYAGFASRQIANLADLLGTDSTPILRIALPIGVSFFTFHLLSYVIDVWRERSPALHRPLDFVTYISTFPQLIAGPIVRYHEIREQLEEVRANRFDDFAAGFPRFAWGLCKKVLIADTIAPVANVVFSEPSGRLTTASAWLGVLAFTLQLYFDFSGYTDMAIGLARMFGFRFPENFARPYSAVSITDFWRRWHMTLSQWFRDYVYVPLGGNRGSTLHTYRNLYIVFLLTGLWHGAEWTFALWGLYHGTLLVLERRNPHIRGPHGLPPDASRPYVALLRTRALLLVMIGWVLFRAPDIEHAAGVYRALFVPSGFGLDLATDIALTRQRAVVIALASIVFLLPRGLVVGRLLDTGRNRLVGALRLVVCTVGAPSSALLVAAGTFSPFLYYKF